MPAGARVHFSNTYASVYKPARCRLGVLTKLPSYYIPTSFYSADMTKLLLLFAVLGIGAGVYYALSCGGNRKTPYLDPEEWWGPNELKGRDDKTLKPFKVKFDEAMVKDLRHRLKSHRPFIPPLEGVGFEYGFNTDQLDSWLTYWADKYNFAEREKFLNQFPQFTTNIQGLDIHFIRVKPQVPAGVKVLPLLIVHGWPGSVREFYEAIPLLTRQRQGYDFVFEVIAPSIPGYGYSDASVRPGLGHPQTAVIFKNLMQRLGFKKFYVQGGDWGAAVVSSIATLYPEDILGHHSNMAVVQNTCSHLMYFFGAFFPSFVVESHLAERMYPVADWFAYLLEEFGYFHLQATKPDSVGVALTDSPAGLLAYVLKKFAVWTRYEFKTYKDGNLGFRFTRDQLIDNLMMYWVPNKITTSMRFYAENYSKRIRNLDLDSIKTPVPTWALQAKNELFYRSPRILRTKYENLINVTVTDDGGHFLALELPEVLAADVFKAVKAFQEFNAKKAKTEL